MIKKDIVSTGVVNLISLILGFAQGIIIANHLGARGKGVLAFYMSLYTLLFSFANLGVKQSTSFFLPKRMVNYSETKLIYLISLVFAFLILLGSFLIQGVKLDSFFFIFLITFPFSIYTDVFSSISLSLRDIRSVNIIRLMTAVSVFSFIVAVYFIFEFESLELFFIGHLISHAINAVFVYFKIVLKYPETTFFIGGLDFKRIKRIIKKGITYCIPLFIYGVNYKVDLLILPRYVSESDLGVYALGVGFAEMIWQIPSVLAMVLFSYSVSQKDSAVLSLKIWANMKKIMLILIPLLLVYIVVLYFFIPIVYGKDFNFSSKISGILLPGTYSVIAFNILNADMAGRGFPMRGVYAFSFGVILNVALNIFLIPKMGIEGSAIASTVSYIVSSVLFIFIYYKNTFQKE